MGKTYKMRNFYETITQFSHKLSISEKQEVFDEIFEFLQFNFKIDSLKIYLKKSGISSSVFDNSDEANSAFFYTYKTKLTNSLELTFGIIFKNKSKLDELKKDTTNINISLDILSMNIYTKHLENTISDILIIDLLTGCYNRTYLNHYIRSIFSLALREGPFQSFHAACPESGTGYCRHREANRITILNRCNRCIRRRSVVKIDRSFRRTVLETDL